MRISTPKIILHIGFHKTGTSALQHYLFSESNENRAFNTISPMCTWLNNADLAWACLGKRFPWQDRDYNFDTVIANYKNSTREAMDKGKDVVISSEEFCRLNEHFDPKFFDRLAEALPLEHCKVLAYVRDPLQFLISRYCHEVMYEEGRKFHDFVRAEISTSDFRVRLKPWFDFFGASRMCIKKYNSGNIVADFNQQFNYGTNDQLEEKVSVGAGVDFALAELYASINRSIQDKPLLSEMRQALSSLPLEKTKKEDLKHMVLEKLDKFLIADLQRLAQQQEILLTPIAPTELLKNENIEYASLQN